MIIGFPYLSARFSSRESPISNNNDAHKKIHNKSSFFLGRAGELHMIILRSKQGKSKMDSDTRETS
jgi:hypothetical protein